MLYVYGVADAEDFFTLTEVGHENAALLAVACEGIAAVASGFSQTEIAPTAVNLWRHERVIEALMTQHTVLPFRFGIIAQSRAALEGCLQLRRAALAADLDRVRGKVELALRVATREMGDANGPEGQSRPPNEGGWPMHPPAPREAQDSALPVGNGGARPGTTYLQGRMDVARRERAWRSRMEHLERSLRSVLDPLSAEIQWEPCTDATGLLKAALLVDRDEVGVLIHAVERLRRCNPQLEVSCTGPWPPYSFVSVRARVAEGG